MVAKLTMVLPIHVESWAATKINRGYYLEFCYNIYNTCILSHIVIAWQRFSKMITSSYVKKKLYQLKLLIIIELNCYVQHIQHDELSTIYSQYNALVFPLILITGHLNRGKLWVPYYEFKSES